MRPELGIIEGHFGPSWNWRERASVLSHLAPAGYNTYHYAPKSAAKLRRAWRQAFDHTELAEIGAFALQCREMGLRFGVGITPFEAHFNFNGSAKTALKSKLNSLRDIGIDDIIILFDDMRGDILDLAERQLDIVAYCIDLNVATRTFMCPTYYSDDPVLDSAFGARPENYLSYIGQHFPKSVSVYWTGSEVCAREIRPRHLKSIAQRLQRPIQIWDNYPVNDGPRLSRYINLRAFTGRMAANAGLVTGHFINPALQPILGCIPALTLPLLYDQGDNYDYMTAFHMAAEAIVGQEMAAFLAEDLLTLSDQGLERLGEKNDVLHHRYRKFDHPAAREIVRWLLGDYSVSAADVQTQ